MSTEIDVSIKVAPDLLLVSRDDAIAPRVEEAVKALTELLYWSTDPGIPACGFCGSKTRRRVSSDATSVCRPCAVYCVALLDEEREVSR